MNKNPQIIIELRLRATLWDAIKMRIAGKPMAISMDNFTAELMKHVVGGNK